MLARTFLPSEEISMIVKKPKPKPKKPTKTRARRTKDWRDAIRVHLAKVAAVDAVFANDASGTVHVYSIVEKFEDDSCGLLLTEEVKVEKAFPKVSFEFHTRAHQGRKPSESGPWGSELVYLR
jgi:hypothetical protein